MRIAQVCPYDLARHGGVQRHILDLSQALSARGHEVTVIGAAPPRAAPERLDVSGGGAPPRRHTLGRCFAYRMHGTTFELTWARAASLERLRLDDAFDVAHFHSMHVPFMPWQVLRRLGARTRRYATFHDTPPPSASGRFACAAFGFMSRRLSRHLDAIVPVSASAGAHLRPVAECPVISLPPCADLAPYFALPPLRAPDSEPTVLFVGRLEPRKGVLIAIDAFAELRARIPRARLVICGDGDERARAEARVAAQSLTRAVTFTGALDEAAKRGWYARASVFCAPSPYGESFGIVLAEAMAAGVPVVAADNAGYRNVLVGDGAAGLVPPGDASALAARLHEVLGSMSFRSRLAQWGRTAARAADVNERLSEFLRLYAAPRAGRAPA
jgi:phosphatidylinositol alpha-mannosyltransferase